MARDKPKKSTHTSPVRGDGPSQPRGSYPPAENGPASQPQDPQQDDTHTRSCTPPCRSLFTAWFRHKESPSTVANEGGGADGHGRTDLLGSTADRQEVTPRSVEQKEIPRNAGSNEQQESPGDVGQDVLAESKIRTVQAKGIVTTTKNEPEKDTVEQFQEETVSQALEDAKSGIKQVQSGPGDIAGIANNTMSQIDAFNSTYLQPLQAFNTVVNTIANLHPYAKMALGVLSWASQAIIDQTDRDKAINDLLLKISAFYKFITEDDRLVKITSMQDTLKHMSEQILECTKFIKNYSETKNFWKRMGKNVLSETDVTVTKYNTTLEGLMQDFRDKATRDTHITTHNTNVTVHRILEHLKQQEDSVALDSMVYVPDAGRNESKKCLEGTRTEILDEIANWINNHDDDVPRVFWLYGQAGMGKSAIAHTIAAWVESLGWLGSCFCFARDRQTERRHEKIFTTIARDLAGRDPLLRQTLASLITENPSLKSSSDVKQQWEKLIVEPLKGLVAGNIVIVIDALDESGDEGTRRQLLNVLASERMKQLLPTVRVFLTSRPSHDICTMLENVPHISARSLDSLDAATTKHDIGQYISDQLKGLRGHFNDMEISRLTELSDGLFEWARLACEFIKPRKAGVNAKRRYNELISRTRGEGSALMDNIYRSILGEIVDDSPEARATFQSVMRQVLWTAEPLPIPSLNVMRQYFETQDDVSDVKDVLDFMAALLSGIIDHTVPVRPLHSSFYDYLTDASRSGVFYVDKVEVHVDLALASVRVMREGLRFNICGLESSYLRNSDVQGLEQRVKDCIPSHLAYACRYWAHHVQETCFINRLVEELKAIFQTEYILFWIEVLSLLR
ncbi:hypothetical protein ID866_9747 [Astraeus odoratus]|nr:hypothetical protein ID866_9747 [Astraeus odoratus]